MFSNVLALQDMSWRPGCLNLMLFVLVKWTGTFDAQYLTNRHTCTPLTPVLHAQVLCVYTTAKAAMFNNGNDTAALV